MLATAAISALALASLSMTAELSPIKDAPFARPNAPIRATLSGVASPCELALLDAQGVERARAQARPGELDLGAIFVGLREAKQAHRVQAIVDGVPQGSPLVVVPLAGRPTIRVTTEFRPDGTTPYTRIIGWGDTLLDPSNAQHVALKASWPKQDPVPMSGFRIERDRDVIFETTAGRIRFAMRPDAAPSTARNFVDLAASGFYDGTIVHRVVPKGRGGAPFVIQGGDPTGTGDGGPGYDIALEPSTLPHDFGVVSMARNDWPDSAGSQWFVALTRAETARLDGQYCAFGQAVEGADAILAIEAGAIGDPETGRPVQPVTVTRAYAVPAPPWTPGKGRPDAPVTRPTAETARP
ncbi:MAG: peptidylprolyl isomerase [Phycisphaerae bacterium]|nr:peptidylprolyl isomerase [Phycisphaerae bacterium]